MQILSSFAIATISNVYFHAHVVESVSSRHPIIYRVPSQYETWMWLHCKMADHVAYIAK